MNTHKELFQFTRLPFGISSAPGIFQRVIETLLQGIEGVVVYIDGILVTGSTEEEHLRALVRVLSRLKRAGLRVKPKKCSFMRPSMTYLGHVIDAHGLRPWTSGSERSGMHPLPRLWESSSRTWAYCLTVTIVDSSQTCHVLNPLYHLLRKDVPWVWKTAQSKAFTASKELLISSHCLTHYDPSLELTLACDASNYGLGVVFLHKMVRRGLLRTPLVRSTRQSATILKSRRRGCHAYLASRGFMTTCCVGTLAW